MECSSTPRCWNNSLLQASYGAQGQQPWCVLAMAASNSQAGGSRPCCWQAPAYNTGDPSTGSGYEMRRTSASTCWCVEYLGPCAATGNNHGATAVLNATDTLLEAPGDCVCSTVGAIWALPYGPQAMHWAPVAACPPGSSRWWGAACHVRLERAPQQPPRHGADAV
jgi:hypothetical protein